MLTINFCCDIIGTCLYYLYQIQIEFDRIICRYKYILRKEILSFNGTCIMLGGDSVENEVFAELKPKQYLCPCCGKWHEWPHLYNLGYYNSERRSCELNCPEVCGCLWIYLHNNFLYYNVGSKLKGRVSISSIKEIDEKIKVDVDLSKSEININDSCFSDNSRYRCPSKDICNWFRLSQEVSASSASKEQNYQIQFGFEFDSSQLKRFFGKFTCFKEETTMENNFNNFEVSQNKDPNLASTPMGIAVKNGNTWRVYDKTTGEITDWGELELSSLPIFIVPTTDIKVGDVIKKNGEYYCIIKKDSQIQTLCIRTGNVENKIPIKNIAGSTIYTKIISFTDIEEDKRKKWLKMMAMTASQNNLGQLYSLLTIFLSN